MNIEMPSKETGAETAEDIDPTVRESCKPLSAAATRALAEAAERRKAAAEAAPAEVNGRGGLDPIRYGDWEINGLASDF